MPAPCLGTTPGRPGTGTRCWRAGRTPRPPRRRIRHCFRSSSPPPCGRSCRLNAQRQRRHSQREACRVAVHGETPLATDLATCRMSNVNRHTLRASGRWLHRRIEAARTGGCWHGRHLAAFGDHGQVVVDLVNARRDYAPTPLNRHRRSISTAASSERIAAEALEGRQLRCPQDPSSPTGATSSSTRIAGNQHAEQEVDGSGIWTGGPDIKKRGSVGL
jgi:hypothetical protein